MKQIECDFCKKEVVVYGRTKFSYWANMCLICFKKFGVGLALVRGQFIKLEKKGDTTKCQ